MLVFLDRRPLPGETWEFIDCMSYDPETEPYDATIHRTYRRGVKMTIKPWTLIQRDFVEFIDERTGKLVTSEWIIKQPDM